MSAFRSLGKDHIRADQLEKLREQLFAADRRVLLKELPLAPAWMHPMMRQLATGKTKP